MGYLNQMLNMPYAYVWLPGLVFALIVGGVYWFFRPAPQVSTEPPVEDAVVASTAAKGKDQRGAYRRHGNPVQVYVMTPEDQSGSSIGSVLDRSVGGMRLALYRPVETGTVMSIRPIHADAMVPWVELEIRSCRPSTEMPELFEVGCQYVKSPPYSIQLLYG